jgi:hypothetical protein
LGLDPYSFALYVCLIDLRKRYADDDIEIVIDRISTPYKRIQLAKQYARTDTFEDLKVENIQMFPLEKTDSFKKIFPIQAADFMAWELRKISEERKDWSPSDNARVNLEAVQEDYRSWAKQFNESRGRFPRQRKSAQRLERATPQKVMCGTCSTSELPIQFGIKLGGVTEVLRDALRLRTMVVQVQAGI